MLRLPAEYFVSINGSLDVGGLNCQSAQRWLKDNQFTLMEVMKVNKLMKDKPDTLVWAKDESGSRHLCPMNTLENANFVKSSEMRNCIDHDERLASRSNVPSNDPQGRIKFPKSVSLN